MGYARSGPLVGSAALAGWAVMIAVAIGVAACSSSPGTTTSTTAATSPSRTSNSTSVAAVKVADNSTYGKILVDSEGMTLYTYGPDKGHGGQSTCTGSCLAAWPALTVTAGATPKAGPGVTGKIAAVKQADDTYQVTYDGMPLYTFAEDSSAGQVTGNGVEGFTVATLGNRSSGSTASHGSPGATTTTTSGSSGYGS